MEYLTFAARLSLAFVCLAAAAGKLGGRRQRQEFLRFIRRLDVPDRLVRPAAVGTVAVELAVALLLPWPATGMAGSVLATGLFLTFTAGVWTAIRRGRTPKCFCFGRLGQPLGRGHLVRNAALSGLAAMTVVLSLFVTGRPDSLTGAAVAAAAAATGALLLVFWDDLAALFVDEVVPAGPGVGR
ncbi:MauE/DoxX family redox-associated membrane protein [Plantactinospora sp. CA-290183]|uniref:MauE/DoxX family redox-associated membrane protein n=1 Tax=Plantactinospora sp. CA-290183 TaxID=3240006 RepID=UPI003D90CE44